MSVIYTNENNPSTLKLIVASIYSKKEVNLNIVNPNDRNAKELKYLPRLQVAEDNGICSPNAAIWYLYPPEENLIPKVNEWLEWESTLLSPSIAQVLGGSVKNEKLKLSFSNLLKSLNQILEKRTSIVEDKITVADISLWATLYPLTIDSGLNELYLHECPNITRWMGKLNNEAPFKDALNIYKLPTSAPVVYNALLVGAKYSFSTISPDASTNQSPTHQPNVVTDEELASAEEAWNKTALNNYLQPVENLVLPAPERKNILITAALPYVNNVPHLGNIIGCVLSADAFARFCRLCNYNTLFIGGTDEYGTATETKALEENLSCQAICDKYYKIHSDIYKWFNISFNHFGRTSTPQQTQLCQSMFLQLNQNGFLFTQSVEQLHCEQCNRYLADRFVEGGCPNIGCTYEDARGDQCDGCGKLVNAIELKNPRCKICRSTPKVKTSSQFFLDLPKLEPLLLHWMKLSSPGWSYNAQVIGKTWLREGLKPRCITRDLKWGVPVPLDGYRQKVFYVWYDAPLGYMSITKNYTEQWERWWRPENDTKVTLYQFMAKDNVPFHAVMFPATLLGANRGYITVSHLMATEYLNYEDGKFSKSRGVGVFGNDAQDTGISSDVFRFYLLFIRPESQDSSFSWVDLATKNNSELLNNLGNFVNRALVFAKNNFNKTVPPMCPTKDDYAFLALCTRELKEYVASLEKAKLRDGIRHILSISRHGNQYMQSNQPWVLLKGSDSDRTRAGTVIGISCNIACLLAILLHPYMPETSDKLKSQLNCNISIINPSCAEIVCLLPAGHKIGNPSPLFIKIEEAQVEELKKKFAGKQNENGTVTKDDVQTIEAELAKQADKVRSLKSSGVTKTVWQPEVDILLSLKKKLEIAKKSDKNANNNSKPIANGISEQPSSIDVEGLKEKVAQQGLVVRKLKEGGAEKTVWQPEVTKLLALKSQLALASGESELASQKSKRGKK